MLTIPENANDLYALPQPVLTSIRRYVLFGFPFVVDAPSKVSLFAYDNHSFVVESFLDAPAEVTISVGENPSRLRNLATNEEIEGKTTYTGRGPHRVARTEFHMTVQPHSFLAFEQVIK